ncbi:hypothetical protein PVAND_007940 [Polypedilum vanderplanki]|uniref:Ribosomal protein eL8/eL30/eS12/Gadd45 domain-containing protein n=1 Tax=Polypedilum vanderplanki TaxID=319348 RepID=A0A9J6C8P6_POLVA|nr:hypothetical protein PVAND_007940 [Polypedilum vanderplanki]
MVVKNSDINQMGNLVKKALVQAKIEDRLILGLSQIVKCLMEGFMDIPTICLMAPPKQGDVATHMQEVLLQAFCLENGIYILHLDSAEKISRILRASTVESCALIFANPSGNSESEGSFLDEDYQLTKIEKQIVNFCEDNWDDLEDSTIHLPDK